MPETCLDALEAAFPGRLLRSTPLSRYTAARVGGPADVLMAVETAAELEEAVRILWKYETQFLVLGGGSNVLVADEGLRGVAVINNAREIQFEEGENPGVWAESGANFGLIARHAAVKGLSGLEWAGSIPGTLGGAVIGNAGANDGDTAGNLILATILHPHRRESSPMDPIHAHRELWPVEKLEYTYRSSVLKRNPGPVVLSASLKLSLSTPQSVQEKMDGFNEKRRRAQPPGASMGSMFKNPPGDYAGRLIEAAGLKGTRIGAAEINNLHANFFLNLGEARAADIRNLMDLAQKEVEQQFGVRLEPEIEFVGEWS